MKHLKKLTLLLIFSLGITVVKAQKISDINPVLKGNVIEITFNIADASFNQKFTIELFVSTDNGLTWQGPMSLIDQPKKELNEGYNKIVWDVFKDISSLDQELQFDIRAKVSLEKVKKHFFVQYSAAALVSSMNYITPLGLRMGTIGKTGWYVAAYFNSFETAAYSFNGESIQEEIFYEFTDKKLYPQMTFCAGLTFQLNWKSYLYAGIGYGTKKYFTQINELNVDNTIKNAEQWVNMTAYDETGVVVESGAILNLNKLNLSLGLSTFNFKHLGVNAGIGLTF